MQAEPPFFSVIMPVYNREFFIEESIKTVLAQTFLNFELICIDDGSTDNTPIVLKNFADADERIKIVTQKNSGRCIARNQGIKIALGKWICFLDSDDGYLDNHLQVMYDLINANKNLNGFATEQVVDRFVKKYDFKKLYKNNSLLDINDFIQTNPVSLNQFCYNKAAVPDLLFPDINILCAEDLLFMRMFCVKHKILKVNTITNYVNEHEDRSVNQVAPNEFATWNRFATEYFLKYCNVSNAIRNKILSSMLLMIGNVLLSSKMKKEGLLMLFNSFRYKDTFTSHLLYKGFLKLLL